MSIARLSAGTGYRYLLKNIARGDGAEPEQTGGSLSAYYAASGYPPGVWLGRGLAGVGDGAGLVAGSAVSEDQMGRLFGAGRDPVTGQALGRPYRTPVDGGAAKTSVAGFDLTFSVPKSVSVLWALADEPTRGKIVAAHHDAVAQVLAVAERDVIRTRVGHAGLAQVETRGVIAAGFDHYDSRAGDPQLHTHVTVANRVQGPDGRWRTVYSRRLFQAAVALSETYDAVLADNITRSLGVGWEWRQRGPGRNPARELAAVPPELVTEFSKRSAAIDTAKDAAIAAFTQTHGRAPTAAEALRIRQRATLSTRDPKRTRLLADYTAAWRERAAAVLGADPAAWAQQVTGRHVPVRLRSAEDVTAGDVEVLAAALLDGVQARRSTWSRWNLQAETCRAITARGLQFQSPADLLAVRDRVTAAAVNRSVLLNTPGLAAVPERWRDSVDGRSVFAFPETYTSTRILAAEDRLLVAACDTTGPVAAAPAQPPEALVAASTNADAIGHEGQEAVVAQICTSGRVCDLLIGPAGAGKSTAMGALRQAWEASHGRGSVTALAPSAAAARVLAGEIGAPAETTAQWIAQQAGTDRRLRRLADLQHRRDRRAAAGIPTGDLDDAITTAAREFDRWRLRPGQLLIVDEASMCDTHTLDALVTQAKTAQAKVLLVGDPAQLPAVGPGGAFAMLTHARSDTPELTAVRRFREPDGTIRTWEADASTALRRGDTTVLDIYAEHGRIHDVGDRDAALNAAYRAWRADRDRGLSSLLIAADNDTVTALNRKAHDDLVGAGAVAAGGVTLSDGTVVSDGDRIITRRVDRHLPDGTTSPRRTPGGALTAGYVTNGAAFSVTTINPDGSLTVRGDRGRPVTLPAAYVAGHVQLGYAVTAHRAQGATVDTAHVLAAPGMTREALYVALTRGRLGNHAHVTTSNTGRGDVDRLENPTPRSPREVLAGILSAAGQPVSAHQAITDLQRQATRPGQIWGEYQTIAADAHRLRVQHLLASAGPRAARLARTIAREAAEPGLDKLVAAVRHGDAYGIDANRLLPAIAATSTDLDQIIDRYARHASAAARARRYRPVVPLVAGTTTASAVTGITDPETRAALLDREHLLAAAQQAAAITAPSAPITRAVDGTLAPRGPKAAPIAARPSIQPQASISYPERHAAQRTRTDGLSR